MSSTVLTLPTSGTNSGSGVDWTNPSGITTDGGISATINSGSASKDLLGSVYGFSIPAGSTINGIEFSARGIAADGPTGTMTFYVYKGGSRAPTSFTNASFGGSTNTVTKGGPTELWGTTWSASDINASNFGTALALASSSNIGSCDWHKVTVYYTPPATNAGFLFNFI